MPEPTPFKVAMRPSRFCVVCPACGEETDVDEWEGGGRDGIYAVPGRGEEIECRACEAPIDVVGITVTPRGEVSPHKASVDQVIVVATHST